MRRIMFIGALATAASCAQTGEATRVEGLPRSAAKQHPADSDLLGITVSRSDLGEIAQELSTDHTFRVRGRDLVQEYRAYDGFTMQGRFSYRDGIITYRPTISTALEHV